MVTPAELAILHKLHGIWHIARAHLMRSRSSHLLAGWRHWLTAAMTALAALGAGPRADDTGGPALRLSIVATSDLHGFVFPRAGRGGVAQLGGYVNNLRAARAADGGAVLLVDSGDTFQGGIESDLTEGALVVDAYHALGYAATAIGNHEFDFGIADGPGARQAPDGDPLGAIKALAARARFPFLAANLIDRATGRRVDWSNVHASTTVDAAGVRVGIVGVMTADAMRATLSQHVRGLEVAPLVPTIEREATALRASGAEVVLVLAHAGGGCSSFDDPRDLTYCDQSSEIFQVARGLPAGLVDAIAAGHWHDGLAHVVNGIAIVEPYSGGRAFSRVDLLVDRQSRRVRAAELFPPREICERERTDGLGCAAEPWPLPQYEGRPVVADPRVVEAMAPELQRVRDLRAQPLGVSLSTAIPRDGGLRWESPLGNLFADALRESTGADLALNNNTRSGLRADLPVGPLNFGALYDVFPFDNRLVQVALTGSEVRRFVSDELRRNRPGAIAVSGLRIRASCGTDARLQIDLTRESGVAVADTDTLVVAVVDMLVSGPVFGWSRPLGGLTVRDPGKTLREVIEDWFRARGGTLEAGGFMTPGRPRWDVTGSSACLIN